MTSRFAYFAGLMTPETIQICATWSSCCGKSESLNAPAFDVARAVLAGGPVCRQRTRRQLTEQLAPRARVRVARREYNSVGSRCRRYVRDPTGTAEPL